MIRSIRQAYSRISPRQLAYAPFIPLGMLLASVYAFYQDHQQPKAYASSGRIVVSGRINLPEGNAYTEELSNFLGTQLEILRSEELIMRARQQMLTEHPEINGSASVRATLLRGTSIITAQATGTNPDYTTRFLDTLLQQLIESRRDRRIETTMSAMKQLREEITAVERQLTSQEQDLYRFKQQHNMVFLGRQTTDSGQLLAQLKSREASLKMQLRLVENLQERATTHERETRVNAIGGLNSGKTDSKPSESRLTEQIAPLRQQLIKLQVEREQLLSLYKPKHPRIIRLDQEILKQSRLVDVLSRESERLYNDNIEGMRSELKSVNQSIEEWESKAMESSRYEAEYEKLQAALSRTRELYSRLVNGLQSIDVSKGVSVDIVQILQRATPAQEITTSRSSVLRNALIQGLLFGLILAVGFAKFDPRGFSSEEIAAAVKLPVAAEIPHSPQLKHLFYPENITNPPAIVAEAMRKVMATIGLSASLTPNTQIILCVSTTPGEGKTTLALHLALHASRSGMKTLLLDADLRRGRLGEKLGLPTSHAGLAELVEQHDPEWSKYVHSVPEADKLDFIPKGNTGQRTVDLLPNLLTDQIFSNLKHHYQLIVIDSAPLLPVADSLNFLTPVDHVLMVTRVKSTSLTPAGNIAKMLDRQLGPKLRMIVNGTTDVTSEYGYYN